ncbi:hypothetical protein BDZ89DRAFT_1130579 [Hymenopellis radicata]|nr:hypothetical protein BDZ89DRAFT_1130579 [Hymenopellis radicata]
MTTFLERILLFTIYPDVQRALQDADDVPRFMRKTSESRNITLLIECTFLGSYLQAGRGRDAACATALLLLTIHIAFLYNTMSPNERVKSIGPVTFTFFQTIPNVFVWLLAVQEIIRSAPNAGVGVVFALLACTPLGYHVVWFEVMAYSMRNSVDTEEQSSSGSIEC